MQWSIYVSADCYQYHCPFRWGFDYLPRRVKSIRACPQCLLEVLEVQKTLFDRKHCCTSSELGWWTGADAGASRSILMRTKSRKESKIYFCSWVLKRNFWTVYQHLTASRETQDEVVQRLPAQVKTALRHASMRQKDDLLLHFRMTQQTFIRLWLIIYFWCRVLVYGAKL